jgi:parallel beta-helix repeat protein
MTLTRSDGLVIKTPGTVIEGVDIRGSVIIDAKNVTLRNCKVTAQSYAVVLINPGITGAVVQNCEISNQGSGGTGIAGQGLFVGNNIHDCTDGIDVRGSNTTIEGNYIHDMNGPSDSHYDGIQADGGFSNLKILRNTVINQKDQTSAIMLSNYWGPVRNVMIDGNLLIGGGYTVYINEIGRGQAKGGPLVNVTFTNNRLGPGVWGHLDLRTELGASPVIAGNTVVRWDYLRSRAKGTLPFLPHATPHSERRRRPQK